MFIKSERDAFGHVEHFTADKFRHILDLIDGYMKGVPYEIHEIWQNNVEDPNGRIDVQIRRENGRNELIMQKLLILKDELIDGETFHRRHDEWYP